MMGERVKILETDNVTLLTLPNTSFTGISTRGVQRQLRNMFSFLIAAECFEVIFCLISN